MFKIEGKEIHINRGDKAVIELTIPDYKFKSGDTITMGVYAKKGLEKEAKLFKTINIEEDCNSVDIILTSADTTIDDIANKAITYWYEIELNNEQTVVGFDEDGPAIFILYPEGSDIND